MREYLKNEPEPSIFDVVKRAAWEAEKIGVSKAVGFDPSPGRSAFSTGFVYFFLWYGFLTCDVPRELTQRGRANSQRTGD